jgi:thiol-disulfide isomerase/thioredoxin
MAFRGSPLRTSALVAFVIAGGFVAVVTLPSVHARQPGAVEAAPEAAAAGPKVPPLPEGTPEELLKFVTGLREPQVRPRTRQEMMAYVRDVAAVSVQAADKILAQVKPDDKFHTEASKLKLESLMMLSRTGDEKAAADMATFATSLLESPNVELAKEARRLLLVSDAQQMFSSRSFEAAPAIIKKAVDLVAADPDDVQTAMLSMQLANALEQVPGGEKLSVAAYEALGPLFAKSTKPQVKQMGESFAGKLRLLSLPGKPMEIKGTLVDGTAFNAKTLAGKVVLVDFWATWCGPCVAEIPNMLEQYKKYHDKGFEIVGISLDDDREALTKFIADKEIPWPILHEKAEGGNPLATFYGITGIPQFILIGRDGNVVTLDARGEKLGERLAELFKDAG